MNALKENFKKRNKKILEKNFNMMKKMQEEAEENNKK
jgi:hypothetical protein